MFLWPWNYVSVYMYIECLWVHLTPVYWFNYTGKYICRLRATKLSNSVNIFIFEIYFVADAPMCALCKLTYMPKQPLCPSTLEPKHRLTLDPRCRLTLEPRRISSLLLPDNVLGPKITFRTVVEWDLDRATVQLIVGCVICGSIYRCYLQETVMF